MENKDHITLQLISLFENTYVENIMYNYRSLKLLKLK